MSALLFPSAVQECIDHPSGVAFLLDFDGTLVHFSPHPDDVVVPHDLIDNLRKISTRNDISFAFVTGRALLKLDSFMEGVTTVAVGSHGAEWRSAPSAKIEALAEPIPLSMRQAMGAIGEKHDCIFEDKAYTISLHLPLDQAHKDLVPELVAAAEREDAPYIIRKIDRTYEILQKNINKGSGIRHLMQQPLFAGKKPLYVGDDVYTDASLETVDQLGGIRLAISSIAALPSTEQTFMRIEAARKIVESLAQR